MKATQKIHTLVATLLALPMIAVCSNSVIYQDSFNGDTLAINAGSGGGMEIGYSPTTYNRKFQWIDTATDLETTNEAGNSFASVYSLNTFSFANGFKLEVTYNLSVVDAGTYSYTATMGLITSAGKTTINSLFLDPAQPQTSLGVSLTNRSRNGGGQGLNQIAPDGTYISLSNAQTITTGTDKIFVLTVDKNGNFTYSIDGQTPTAGTTTFDLSKELHFAAYGQHNAGFEIQSVTLSLPLPSSLGLLTSTTSL